MSNNGVFKSTIPELNSFLFADAFIPYTGALNQILLLSFFAWPSRGYLANKQVITGSYLKHVLDHYDTVLANQRASSYYA